MKITLCCMFFLIQHLHAVPHDRNVKKGDKVISLDPVNAQHIDVIRDVTNRFDEGVILWSNHLMVGQPVLLQIGPKQFSPVIQYIQNHDIPFHVSIDDVEDAIHQQVSNRVPDRLAADFNFSVYHTLDEIEAWLHKIGSEFKDISKVFKVAESYEGRDIYAIKISTGSGKKAIWLDGGIHAREWVAPAVMVYFIDHFLRNYGHSDNITAILDKYDMYILPVFNVDGYSFTWTYDQDIKNRMWRKTRRPTVNPNCIGADPNRNWDFHWNTTGVSPDPCSEQYPGDFPFSEPEVLQVANFVEHNNILAYLAYHSYSQFFMLPSGFTAEQAKDYPHLQKLCQEGHFKVYSVHGKEYLCGSLANLVGTNSGSSADYTYGVLGIRYSFGVELRDTGEYGFLLPPDQIIPTAEENLPFVIHLALNLQ